MNITEDECEYVYHIANNTIGGLEEVKLVANNYSKKNQLAVYVEVYEDPTPENFKLTGGIIFKKSPIIKGLFEMHPTSDHYELARTLRQVPFAKPYIDENGI